MTQEEKQDRIDLLLAQCRKHQVFREKKEEAMKQAEAGRLLLELDDTEQAGTCLNRAKRLCRDITRGRT